MSFAAYQLSFAYGTHQVIRELELELSPGEVLGVVGPNGAGKSTLINLLTRILMPSHGTISLDGGSIKRMSRLELARRVAVVPQAGDLPGAFRVIELVMMGRTPHLGFLASETPHDLDVVEKAMRRTDVWAFRERHVGELSGGERQRVLLARALAQEPTYLLLDEPTNHLDLRYQSEVLRFTRREVARGVGALVVLHDLNLAARVCDRVMVLHQGRCVAAGTPPEVLTEALIRQIYNADTDVFLHPQSGLPVILPRL